tara:strand:- start:212 stop:343 length:132 start_codon:yes stop_codon:yes gene_type:complete
MTPPVNIDNHPKALSNQEATGVTRKRPKTKIVNPRIIEFLVLV